MSCNPNRKDERKRKKKRKKMKKNLVTQNAPMKSSEGIMAKDKATFHQSTHHFCKRFTTLVLLTSFPTR